MGIRSAGGVRLVTLAALAVLAVAAMTFSVFLAVDRSGAWFTAQRPVHAEARAARIFRAERDATAVQVIDRSSGSSVDASNPLAFAGDGRHAVSQSWTTTFDASRHYEIDFDRPLPGGLSVSSTVVSLAVASSTTGVTTCYYIEARQVSTGGLLSSHGSAASPLGCVTGTGFASTTVALPAVSSSDLANDLRVRLYASNGSASQLRVDAVTLSGETPYAPFTLYPLLTRETSDGQAVVVRWGLAGP